jgi:hypothetical protein
MQVYISYSLPLWYKDSLALVGVLVDPRDDLKFSPSDRQKVEEFKDLIWYSG